MNTAKKTLRALNYFGGKSRQLDFILPLFPEHKNYVEPFCGSAVVFLNKKPSPIETISDLDGRLINFFQVLRDHPQQLVDKLSLTLYSRGEFMKCREHSGDPIEDARRYFVTSQQSFGGQSDGFRRINSWRVQMSETRRGISMDVSKWLSKIDGLIDTVDRFKMAHIENRPWGYIIPKFDYRDTFYFCDPPYVHATRTGKNDYKHEMKNEDHERLAEILNSTKGKVMICGYENDLYKSLFPAPKWKKYIGPDTFSNLGKSKSYEKRELVWINYDPPGASYRLFE
jgi:DNA adenine methylase